MKKAEFLLLCGAYLALALSCSKVGPPESALEASEFFLSSSEEESSSSEGEDSFIYCVYVASKNCTPGTFTECPEGGWVSNNCPYDDPSNSSSSGSRPSSSSGARPSSSSTATPQPVSSSSTASPPPVPSSSSAAVTPPLSSSAGIPCTGGSYTGFCGYVNSNSEVKCEVIPGVALCNAVSGCAVENCDWCTWCTK